MLLENLRWVREASHVFAEHARCVSSSEPWMKLLENQGEWVEAVRQLDIRCTKPKKPECARNASAEMLLTNPQEFLCMIRSADKRRCCAR